MLGSDGDHSRDVFVLGGHEFTRLQPRCEDGGRRGLGVCEHAEAAV